MSAALKVLVPLERFLPIGSTESYVRAARTTYLQKLALYQLMPLFVHPEMSSAEVDEAYRTSWGVVFMGGSDVAPAVYGEQPHPETERPDEARDRQEVELLHRILQDQKPFLGICRGCQLLAAGSGGKLIQHLPDVVATESHDLETYDLLFHGKKHSVTIEPGTRLHRILKAESGVVNSAHHQAVQDVSSDFQISARSPAGVIEAIEHRSPQYFCIGIQPHPEAEQQGFFEPIFPAFSAAVRAYGIG